MTRGRLLPLALLLLTGCHQSIVVAPTEVAADQDVAISLTAQGADIVAPMLGSSTRTLTGRVISVTDAEIALLVSRSVGPNPLYSEPLRQEVLIPRDQVLAVERRELDRVRTAGIVLVAGAAVAWAASQLSGNSSSGGPDSGGGGGPIPILAPLVRILFQ